MIQKFTHAFSVILIGFISLTSCSSDDATEVDTGSEYIQLSEGSWFEYKLDSTIYDDFDNSVTLYEWDLRVEIGETFTENGRELIRMRRFLKPRSSDGEYNYQKTFFASLQNGRLETFEDNLHFVKFLLPAVEGKTWKGNEFISPQGNDNPNTSTQFYEDWDYTYESLGESMDIQGQAFNDVAHINQSDRFGGTGAINHFISDEWYAYGVGLVKKRMEIVVENQGDSDKTIPVLEREEGRKGFILDMEITNYHIE